MERILTIDTISKAGKIVKVSGWVDTRRDHGKIIFIDFRDRSGILQLVFTPKDKELYGLANTLRGEWVIEVEGKIGERPKGVENPELTTGNIEMLVEKLVILNEAKTPPFALNSDGYEIGEDNRLRYRYLDLRRARLQKNIGMRHKMALFMRNAFSERGFVEIETPSLTKGTPEGAREFIVPSRLHPGKFFVLPQSPQQFKQLLMVSGFERYFQFARCFRDEDERKDRQPEFTQLDVEISFLDEESIRSIIEEIVIKSIGELFPAKKILKTPFPVMSQKEAVEKYNSDKPDIRENKNDFQELAFLWVVDFPLFEYSETEKGLVSSHHPFTSPKDGDLRLLEKNPEQVMAKAYDLVLNGYEIGGGSIRIHRRDLQEKIFRVLGLAEEEIKGRFGHMLEAFEYGAPPHGGIALGIDRFVAILQNEPSIREVMAFPKTGDARDLMMDAPSEVSPKQLKEAHINIIHES